MIVVARMAWFRGFAVGRDQADKLGSTGIMADSRMNRLEFHRSPAKQIGLLLISLALAGGGGYEVVRGDSATDRMMGGAAVLLFGMSALVRLKRAMQGGVAFVLDSGGISSQDDAIGLIPWSEVERCSVVTIKRTRFLSLTFRDPDRILSRVSSTKRKLAFFNESMGWGHWAFSFAGLDPGMDEALRFIRQNAPGVSVPPET